MQRNCSIQKQLSACQQVSAILCLATYEDGAASLKGCLQHAAEGASWAPEALEAPGGYSTCGCAVEYCSRSHQTLKTVLSHAVNTNQASLGYRVQLRCAQRSYVQQLSLARASCDDSLSAGSSEGMCTFNGLRCLKCHKAFLLAPAAGSSAPSEMSSQAAAGAGRVQAASSYRPAEGRSSAAWLDEGRSAIAGEPIYCVLPREPLSISNTSPQAA